MKKNIGRSQQIRGHKRVAKQVMRKHNKRENLEFVAKLMSKYGINLKLTERIAGEKYLKDYLNG
jgi:NMD protein affecting ribosome stability and mRNA decay